MKDYLFKTIIFDLDGTLVDSKLDFCQMRKEIGIPKDFPILEYLEKPGLTNNFKRRAHSIIHAHELKGAEVATPLADIDEFILWLNEKDFPVFILTRNSTEVTLKTLEKFSWKFEKIYTRDNAPPKPEPDAILKVQKNLGLKSCDILYIGDSMFDLLTAENAGCVGGFFINKYNYKQRDLIEKANLSIKNYSSLNEYLDFSITSTK